MLRTSSRACFELVAALRIAVTCPKKSSSWPRGEVSALDRLEIRITASIVPTARLKVLLPGFRAEPFPTSCARDHCIAPLALTEARSFERGFGIGAIVSIVRSLHSLDLDESWSPGEFMTVN